MVFNNKFHNTLLYLILWRSISVFIVQTAHVPDEYWQSVEVAHQLVFKYGYLTWEWRMGIRSYIYPFFISLLYRLLAMLHLDYVTILTTAPRLFQAILSAYADYRFYVWTQNKWALFSLCINWYWYYCATRTLTNSVETALTTIALSIFPWQKTIHQNSNFIWIVAFVCIIRPTAAIIWIPLCLYHFCINWQNRMALIGKYTAIGIISLSFLALVDMLCYRDFIISPWEFFRINVLYEVGDHYGVEHSLWYFTYGLPVMLGFHYIIFLMAVWQTFRHFNISSQQMIMMIVIGWTIGVYSTLSHKEFRFLLPLLPMFIYLSMCSTSCLKYRATKFKRKIFVAILIVNNLLPGLYLCLIHQRGSLDVMKVLHNEVANADIAKMDILFLTPCHATPLYSHLHVNVTTRFLTCEPNLKRSQHYMDEADIFFTQPSLWLNDNYIQNKSATAPSHVIMYDSMVPRTTIFLRDYRPLVKVFDSHFPRSNYGEYLMVYKRKTLK